ncbi:MAG TPA: hypothetical protein VNN80_20995, partial [Polyangiaceae bacterium]|nr:hypothetical protein [Polyangiaceae bacterium]
MIELGLGIGGSTDRRGTLRATRMLSAAGALLLCLACGKSDDTSDDGVANYYLSGRVVDGNTLEPLAQAEVSLNVGEVVATTLSAPDGSFHVGPIAPDSDYRIGAQFTGYDRFSFYGARLPHLNDETDRDRALVGDVALFRTDGQSPAFIVSASSSDTRLPLDTSSAEVRLIPVRLGVDPVTRLALGSGADAGAPVSVPLDQTWLPNHALSDVPAYRSAIVGGQAAIPAGALRNGAAYNLEAYGGPAFEPQSVQIAAGRASDMSVWLTPSPDSFSTELPDGFARYYSGRIYDGVSLQRLTNYSMQLEYFDRVIPATVDANGRYFVGPLLADADYSVVIQAEGFRSFLSHNERLSASGDTLLSLYYDAFLYPDGIASPGATCRVRLSDSNELPTGFMRFAPTSSSSLMDEDEETPVGVTSSDAGRQLWSNDEDLQQRSLVLPFTNGELALASGQLVYGVAYTVTIYGVAGHEAIAGSFTAGVDGDKSWVLDPLVDSPLAITSLSSDELTPASDGTLAIRFNQPIALDPGVNATTLQRALNNGFFIDSPNTDGDANQNVLVDDASLTPPIDPGYAGVSLEIVGDVLYLRWDRATGLATTDADEPILWATYNGLSAVMVYA